MKTKILTILMFVFSFVLLKANERKAYETRQADTASISFNETTHDYGTIKKGSDGSCVFTFTNSGKIPLVLSNVQASCGCTTPYWPKTPVAPGKSGEIKIEYNTGNVGAFQKTITVYSNAQTIVLTIKGTVLEK